MTSASIALRHDLRPGDIGSIVLMHGAIYGEEYALDATFEAYVARPLADLVIAGPNAGRVWIAELSGEIVGSIAVVWPEPDIAQIRWVILAPQARGNGNGRAMMETAMAYARERGAARAYLWSFTELDAAIALYRRFGFAETERRTARLWGRTITELRMDTDLA